MGQLSLDTFEKWFRKNPAKISEIYTTEGEGFAKAKFTERNTALNAAIVQMFDPSDESHLLETFLIALSDEPLDKDPNKAAKIHLDMVLNWKPKAPVSELFIQVDEDLNTKDYFLKSLTTK